MASPAAALGAMAAAPAAADEAEEEVCPRACTAHPGRSYPEAYTKDVKLEEGAGMLEALWNMSILLCGGMLRDCSGDRTTPSFRVLERDVEVFKCDSPVLLRKAELPPPPPPLPPSSPHLLEEDPPTGRAPRLADRWWWCWRCCCCCIPSPLKTRS